MKKALRTEIPTHSHDTDNVGVNTKGELVLTLHDKTERIGVGQWYRVPANGFTRQNLKLKPTKQNFGLSQRHNN